MRYYLDMFSGIGGFRLGADWAGLKFDKYYFSEVDEYAVKNYQKRFPGAENLGDIRAADYSKLPQGVWFVSGGFPCQPHSAAGKKRASQDERDLWPECGRMLRELRPRAAMFENVPGLLASDGGRFFNRVLSEIYESGYDAEWAPVSAAEAGARHLRNRVWIVCYGRDGRDLGWNPHRQDERSQREISEGLCP
jgi:DNA (cytosine-5)-methyltransferase 1